VPLLLRPAPLFGLSLWPFAVDRAFAVPQLDDTAIRYRPHYPSPSPLADILKLVPPGADDYVTEKYAVEIESVLAAWSNQIKASSANIDALSTALDPGISITRLRDSAVKTLRSSFGIDVLERTFAGNSVRAIPNALSEIRAWLGTVETILTAEFEIFSIEVTSENPLSVRVALRYDIVASRSADIREERVGTWHMQWQRDSSNAWKALELRADAERLCVANGGFLDITSHALGANASYHEQLLHGADDWRTVLDAAVGLDVYSNNGVAVGDFDNDGFDDLYVCQPSGLPNRLFRNRGDGAFEDVTEKAGVGVLDNTAGALFADFDNRGLQDLLVVCGTGPLLFVNRGDGTFALKRDAFHFAQPPQGTFTHAAVADYDNDGRLDVYFCMYQYYLGLEQYHYPVPYYDARNGPPNSLFRNFGGGKFVETTSASGIAADNNRYSFAAAWGNIGAFGPPDLFVANDFGTSQLYRNKGNGSFDVVSAQSGVEGVGAGMGCAWADYDNDGHMDVYVPSMWEAAGQRISQQPQFHPHASLAVREKYIRHSRGNALYRNQGDGTFQNVGRAACVEMGRWSWSSDFFDFDHDGFADLYVANGYLSGPDREDLSGFFWRQVVAKSPDDTTPTPAYEHGWSAINELVRSDNTWHGYSRNVAFTNCGNGTFAEASGAIGLDCLEDSRAFALADVDHDGRLEVILKNRNAPQLRVLKNALPSIGASISFSLRGVQSNRDAIGAAVIVEAGSTRQTKYIQAGSGFLSQHSKELFFGLGDAQRASATIHWPSGKVQRFDHLPAHHRISIAEDAQDFKATPYSVPPAFIPATPAPRGDQLPDRVATWLIDPLAAPDFSLPDLSGAKYSLSSFAGHNLLLTFWSTASPASLELLRNLEQRHSSLTGSGLTLLAVNLDGVNTLDKAHNFAAENRFSFPVLFATDECAGVYNLIYRYLFDRRRDLPIPATLLVDAESKIVKLYQGPFDLDAPARDAAAIPRTAVERQARALPFPGLLTGEPFQRNVFTYGIAMYQHGYLDQAAASFRQVIGTDPENAEAYYNLGTLYLRTNDIAQARHFLEQTLKVKPDYAEAWNNLGMIAAQQGEFESAIQNFQHALTLRPGFVIALVNLGNLYRRARQYDAAERLLTQALAAQPDDPEVNYSLGMLYAQRDRADLAEKYLRAAIALRPDYPEALNNLGVLFVRRQDFAPAEEQFRTAIHLAPDYEGSYLNLARLFVLQNKNDQARDILQQLLHLHPGSSAATQALDQIR
jgi:Flp pilus assembly protein TadD